MKRVPKEVVNLIRAALAQAWEEGYNQAKAEAYRGGGMGEYGGYYHVNPYKETK